MRRSLVSLFAAAMLIFALQSRVAATSLEAALEAMDRDDFDAVVRLIEEEELTQLLHAITELSHERYGPFINLVRPLAEQGHTASQYLVGDMYREGGDIREAMRWYRRAARKGHTEAQFRLGASYYSGIGGTPVKTVEGLAWINVAAARGHEEAADMKAALALLTPRLSEAERRQVDVLTQRYWNDHVLPFLAAE